MNITKEQLKQIIKEELQSINLNAHQKKVLDMLKQAANLISDAADLAAVHEDDDLKRHMHSMVDEIHRQFGSHEDEVEGI